MFDKYKYKLEYIDDDQSVVHEFDASIDIYELEERLRRFLYASGWDERLVNKLFGSRDE